MRKIILSSILLVAFFSIQAQKSQLAKVPVKGFHSSRPAVKWEEYLLTGNGTMGAMVAGNPFREIIVFNHSQLFLPIHTPIKPVSQGENMPKIRKMMLDGLYGEASRFVVDLANSEGFKGKHATDPFIPAFQLNILSDSSEVRDYSRSVDFSTGEAEVKWQDQKGIFYRKTFVSRTDNIVVIKLSSYNGALINTELKLSQILNFDKERLKKFRLDEKCGILKTENKASEGLLSFRTWYEKTYDNAYNGYSSFKGYDGVIKIHLVKGTMKTEGDKVIIKGAKEVLLLAKVEPSKNMEESKVPEFQKQLSSITPDYDALLKKHKKIHNELFSRVTLDLSAAEIDRQKTSEQLLEAGGSNPAVIEKLFDAARYNIISATGVNPPNLQGIWGATMTPNWSGDFTTNGNLPVAASHYLQANTPELMLPLFNKLESFMGDFRVNAKVLYNCRGIHVPSHICMHGLENHFDATWPMTFWTAGAAWYSLYYYDYYLYTLNKKFLEERALPFMEESALFYEDFLTEGPDGKYIFNPSYSPENNPLNSKYQACINATMDVMAANGLFRVLIESSRILGVNQDKIAKWEAIHKKLPAYELNQDGELREWIWKDLQDNHKHRHASQLFGLYDLRDPLIMNNPELVEGARKTIKKRLEIRRRENGGIMAFGMHQLAFSAASLEESDLTYEMLTWIGNSYWNNNLATTHDPKKIFNMDTSGGYPSLVMKMLVYSEPGFVSVFPAKPDVWANGVLKGAALRGGIEMTELKWEKNTVEIVLKSKIDQTVKIRIQDKDEKDVKLSANKEMKLVYALTNTQKTN